MRQVLNSPEESADGAKPLKTNKNRENRGNPQVTHRVIH